MQVAVHTDAVRSAIGEGPMDHATRRVAGGRRTTIDRGARGRYSDDRPVGAGVIARPRRPAGTFSERQNVGGDR